MWPEAIVDVWERWQPAQSIAEVPAKFIGNGRMLTFRIQTKLKRWGCRTGDVRGHHNPGSSLPYNDRSVSLNIAVTRTS